MDKKAYIAPEMELMNIEIVDMLAASVRIGEGEVDASESFSNKRRGSWGDLWGGEE